MAFSWRNMNRKLNECSITCSEIKNKNNGLMQCVRAEKKKEKKKMNEAWRRL